MRPPLAPLLVAAACGALTAAPARAAVITGPVVNPANGHSYYLLTANTWTASEAEAVGLGGHLVTINDAAENAWVFSTFANFGGVQRSLWIGLNDAAAEGTFVWASGDPTGLTLWSGGQPDNGFPGPNAENYVHTLWPGHPNLTPGLWNDFQNLNSVNGFPLNGVVEVAPAAAVPEPASLVLAAFAGVGVAVGVLRRRTTQTLS